MGATGQGRTNSVETRSQRLPKGQFESWIIQAEMIAHGLSTVRYPKNALMSVAGNEAPSLAFIDGESSGSSLAGEAIVRNGSAWRKLLGRRRIPVASWMTFRANDYAKMLEVAESYGFPVRVRSARQDFVGGISEVAMSGAQLERHVKSIRGQFPGSRILLEEGLCGVSLNALVVAGEVLSVIQRDDDGTTSEVVDRVSPSIIALSVDAIRACSGLNDGSVLISSRPHAESETSSAVVQGISPSPMLSARLSSQSEQSGAELMRRFVQKHADNTQVALSACRDVVDGIMEFAGFVDADTFVEGVCTQAQGLGLSVLGVDKQADGEAIELRVCGGSRALAFLALQSVLGFGGGMRSHRVLTKLIQA